MNADLLRQRRNLIAISVVLLIFDFADVRITKVGVLGTELLVGNVQILMICAWTLWAYFMLRYYQYWRVQSDRHIRDSFKNRLDKYVRIYTEAKAVQDPYGQIYDDYKICRIGLVSWTYTLQQYDPAVGAIKDATSTDLPALKMAAWSAKAAAFVCIQTPHATDHVLPFVLAVAAPVATLFSRWPPQ